VVELKPDFIKVDRSLVDGVAGDHARRVAVSAFVLLALDLNALVVAEGVEQLDDLSALCDLGVDAAQGYLLARPSTDLADLRHWRWQSPQHAALIAGARS
jgi:EAL domain-containing protein (putative c-di-GMP-specific phosphodiesterase class I)